MEIRQTTSRIIGQESSLDEYYGGIIDTTILDQLNDLQDENHVKRTIENINNKIFNKSLKKTSSSVQGALNDEGALNYEDAFPHVNVYLGRVMILVCRKCLHEIKFSVSETLSQVFQDFFLPSPIRANSPNLIADMLVRVKIVLETVYMKDKEDTSKVVLVLYNRLIEEYGLEKFLGELYKDKKIQADTRIYLWEEYLRMVSRVLDLVSNIQNLTTEAIKVAIRNLSKAIAISLFRTLKLFSSLANTEKDIGETKFDVLTSIAEFMSKVTFHEYVGKQKYFINNFTQVLCL